jgi:IS1 family transposase
VLNRYLPFFIAELKVSVTDVYDFYSHFSPTPFGKQTSVDGRNSTIMT